MNIIELRTCIKEIQKITDDEWMKSLDERKLKELEFHDKDRDKSRVESMDKDSYEKYYGNKKFYKTVRKSKEYIDGWIKQNAKDKVFLDYACGDGEKAIIAAKSGANLSLGLDISSVSVRNAQEQANMLGLDNAVFFQADAENTNLPDHSIDIILCAGMLHHLDLNFAFPELARILAPGGKILCGEALAYNPFIKLYRARTSRMRTDWEKAHILSLNDVKKAKRYFEIGDIKFWHITSYLAAFLPPLLAFFNSIDSLLTKIHIIKRMAWIFTFELKYKA
ncbi:MAG: class I SAM-dependent methyltransferase [Bacteroidota bacterium]